MGSCSRTRRRVLANSLATKRDLLIHLLQTFEPAPKFFKRQSRANFVVKLPVTSPEKSFAATSTYIFAKTLNLNLVGQVVHPLCWFIWWIVCRDIRPQLHWNPSPFWLALQVQSGIQAAISTLNAKIICQPSMTWKRERCLYSLKQG